MVATSVTEQANKSRFTDSDYWIQFEVPAPDEGSGHWAVVKERLLTSSQTLGILTCRCPWPVLILQQALLV